MKILVFQIVLLALMAIAKTQEIDWDLVDTGFYQPHEGDQGDLPEEGDQGDNPEEGILQDVDSAFSLPHDHADLEYVRNADGSLYDNLPYPYRLTPVSGARDSK